MSKESEENHIMKRLDAMIDLEIFLGPDVISSDEQARTSRWPVEGYHYESVPEDNVVVKSQTSRPYK